MKEDNATVMPEVGPDLLVSPHILPALMELFAGERQQVLSEQEQLFAHLATCHYCRTAVMVLLSQELEYDRRNNDAEETTRDLLMRFANINRSIEAREAQEYERLGAYAEAIVDEGRDRAALRFPEVAAHLKVCSDCRSALEATVVFITEPEEIGSNSSVHHRTGRN
jgi:uncharacterized protein YigA (DUF484 family)